MAGAVIEHLSIEEWIAFDRARPAPTGFARPYWSLALSQAYPALVADPLRISTPGVPPLVVALVRNRGGKLPWRIWHGSVLGAYTCFVHEDGTSANADETAAAIETLIRESDACDITPWPLAGGMDDLRFTATDRSLHHVSHETAVIDLREGIAKATERITGTSRRMARQAVRLGVTCSVERGSASVGEYYRMLEESAVRWGISTPTIPRQLIEACVRFGGEDVETWFARVPDTSYPIAGCVILRGAQEAFLWSGAMRIEYSQLRPNNALYAALLAATAERGLRWLNLGSSEGLPGVARFKRNFGARNTSYVTVRYERGRLTAWKRLREAVAPW